MFVYWVHTSEHKDPMTQGYIGITKDFNERMRSHQKNSRKTPFTDAIKKYGWANLQKDVICTVDSLEEALKIEQAYRPTQFIGWNHQRGGELGVESAWYENTENKTKHSQNTSMKTKEGIAKEPKGARAERAKEVMLALHGEQWRIYDELLEQGKTPKEIASLTGKRYTSVWRYVNYIKPTLMR